jgi:hypothetical protein
MCIEHTAHITSQDRMVSVPAPAAPAQKAQLSVAARQYSLRCDQSMQPLLPLRKRYVHVASAR